VGENPVRIAYQVLPLTPGWHRIGPGPARLEMKDRDGLDYARASNDSPRILVLPRLGWPITFLLLNPLFWLLFGRLSRGRRLVLPEPPPAPPPVPLPAPEPVVARVRRERKRAVSPTLVLGVGHSGALVLRALRDHLRRLPIRPAAEPSFLCVDVGAIPEDDDVETCFGEPFGAGDRVTLETNVLPLFERHRGAPEASPQLAWLDPVAESEGLTPRDFDLSEGTRGRRVLARAAFYAHLDRDEPRLTAELDCRLRALGDHSRILVVASLGGGTGSGVLPDLLVWLRKRLKATGVEPRGVDVFLLSHRALAAERQNPSHYRNARALATELSRHQVRRHLPILLPQTRAECESRPEAVSRAADGIYLLERPLEARPGLASWPALSGHSAALAVMQMLLYPDEALDRFLEDNRGDLRLVERGASHAMVTGLGATGRWLPLREIGALLAARAVLEFLSRDLLILEPVAGRLSVRLDDEMRKIGRQEAARLLAGAALQRSAPPMLSSLEALAERSTAGGEAGKLIGRLEHFPGTSRIPTDLVSERLIAEVLDHQALLLRYQLEEWALRVLNGSPGADGDFDPEHRRAGLLRLVAAVDHLDERGRAAVQHLEAMEHTAPEPRHRYEFLLNLFSRYRGAFSGLRGQLCRWLGSMVPTSAWAGDSGDAEEAAPTVSELAEVHLQQARKELGDLVRHLAPVVVWSSEMEERLAERHVGVVRRRLLEQTVWIAGSDPASAAVGLQVQQAKRVVFHHAPSEPKRLFEELLAAAWALGIDAVEEESVAGYLDLASWLRAGGRPEPVELDPNLQAAHTDRAPRPREFARLPPESLEKAAGVSDELEIGEGEDSSLAAVVRVLTPCDLFAADAVTDYDRRLRPEPHRDLPFLDPVDRLAAEHEDWFPDYGLSVPFLTPALRAYFVDRAALRVFVLGVVLGRVRKLPGETGDDVLRWGGLGLTSEPREPGYPLLLEALDRFVVARRTARDPARAIDVAALDEEVGGLLAASRDDDLRGRTRPDCPEMAAVLTDCPRAVRADLRLLAELFIGIELRGRSKGGSS